MNGEAKISPLHSFAVCVANFLLQCRFHFVANGLKKVKSKTEVFFIDFLWETQMKVNIFQTILSLGISAIASFALGYFCFSDNALLLGIGSFLTFVVSLTLTMGIDLKNETASTNVKVLSGIFFCSIFNCKCGLYVFAVYNSCVCNNYGASFTCVSFCSTGYCKV